MALAKLFTHGGSQAVRLPKEFRFEGSVVHMRRVGTDVFLSAEPPASVQSLIDAQGTPIGPYDTQIAAHAQALGVTLVSNKLREFSRVPGLHGENWAAAR